MIRSRNHPEQTGSTRQIPQADEAQRTIPRAECARPAMHDI